MGGVNVRTATGGDDRCASLGDDKMYKKWVQAMCGEL